MASQSYDPQDDWRRCITARLVPLDTITNIDMTGVMVGVAAVVLNFCLRIQIEGSDEAIDAQVLSTIAQAYCILIPTLLSIGHHQLSLFDAHYTLAIISSPLMIQVVISSVREILGFETGLFKRIKSHHRAIYFSVVPFLALSLGLKLTLRLSSKAFRDSGLCSNRTFKDLLADVLFLFIPTTGPLAISWCFLSILLVWTLAIIIAGCCQVVASSLTHCEIIFGPWEGLSRLWVALNDVWELIEDHRTMKLSLYIIVDSCWAVNLVFNAYAASGEGYKVSFGQLLALFTALPPLLSTTGLVYDHKESISSLFTFRSFFLFIISILGIAFLCFTSIMLGAVAVDISERWSAPLIQQIKLPQIP